MNKTSPSSEVNVRAATCDDITLIQDIVAKTWPAAYTDIIGEKQVNYMIEKFYSRFSLIEQMNNKHYFFLAFQSSDHIGFASFSLVNENTSKLQKLYVLPSEQKTGAGKSLLKKVEREAKNMGATKLQLNVNRKNTAKTFYEKNGFIIMREEDIDIGNGFFMNDYVMEKKLTPALS